LPAESISTATAGVPSYPDLAGKVCVINGGRVEVNGRDPAAVQERVELIRAEDGDAVGITGDVMTLLPLSACARRGSAP
jgi:hypothetical protein